MTNRLDQLLAIIDVYRSARARGGEWMSDARVSTLLFGGGTRIKQLREGRDIGVKVCERALLWLSTNWPEGAVWPADVLRPRSDAEAPSDREVAA
jgi:hypothetical protein